MSSWRTHPQRCHAGACHAPAVVFGVHGDLCWPCFVRVTEIIARYAAAREVRS